MNNNNSVVCAIVNRNGKALVVNGSNNKCSMLEHDNSNKASLLAMAKLLEVASKDNNMELTILVPKNLNFILRKESVYQWIDNGNKTKNGTELDSDFIELCKYVSDMRLALGRRVKVKMTGTILMTPEEEQLMKLAWNHLDKKTGYNKNNAKHETGVSYIPNMPESIARRLNEVK
jgi:hypothetical protein